MPKIASISTYSPPYTLAQADLEKLTKELFEDKMPRLERLLKVFANGEIESRHFCVPPNWFEETHRFEERNDLYVEIATAYGVEVIKRCLTNKAYLSKPIATSAIDAIIFVSSTGIATPSIDAKILNALSFSDDIVRLPIWGLGCVGGAAGISRAFDYCLAHPMAKVLVVCVELCSLTFQKDDLSKSNLVGASLFADGASCVLVYGDEVSELRPQVAPHIVATRSKWMPNSEDVMGWEVKDSGFHVVFSRSIPGIIETWLGPFIAEFLAEQKVEVHEISHFIAHPGGKKVLAAYEKALSLTEADTAISREVLRRFGNMSSPTVHFVLERFMERDAEIDSYALLVALGPGFSGEAVLLQWRD